MKLTRYEYSEYFRSRVKNDIIAIRIFISQVLCQLYSTKYFSSLTMFFAFCQFGKIFENLIYKTHSINFSARYVTRILFILNILRDSNQHFAKKNRLMYASRHVMKIDIL